MRVLDQLLDRRRRTLDDLAGGDAVDEGGRELADHRGHCAPGGARLPAADRFALALTGARAGS